MILDGVVFITGLWEMRYPNQDRVLLNSYRSNENTHFIIVLRDINPDGKKHVYM